MKIQQMFDSMKFEIGTTFQKLALLRKLRLINIFSYGEIRENKKCKIKKCNFAFCINKIDKEAMCEFQFTRLFMNSIDNCYNLVHNVRRINGSMVLVNV